MKKTILALLAGFICSFSVAFAQEWSSFTVKEEPIKKAFISVYGGPTFSINENGGSYFSQGKPEELIDWVQGGASVGYYFSNRYGARLSFEYSDNHSAANYDQTWVKDLYSYTFKSYIGFADFIVNGGYVLTPKHFNWRPYVGIGAAYSFGLTDSHHPWQGGSFTDPNVTFAMRYGLILEYTFNFGLGIFVDGNHEWFTDSYNGMNPHAGFPFDMKLNANFGLAFHF